MSKNERGASINDPAEGMVFDLLKYQYPRAYVLQHERDMIFTSFGNTRPDIFFQLAAQHPLVLIEVTKMPIEGVQLTRKHDQLAKLESYSRAMGEGVSMAALFANHLCNYEAVVYSLGYIEMLAKGSDQSWINSQLIQLANCYPANHSFDYINWRRLYEEIVNC